MLLLTHWMHPNMVEHGMQWEPSSETMEVVLHEHSGPFILAVSLHVWQLVALWQLEQELGHERHEVVPK